jgi:Protein of unknown function (DUF3866)
MLKLRRGTVSSVESTDDRVTRMLVQLDSGEQRAAIAYPILTGPIVTGDDVVVNVQAKDLSLGSGGFDVVCVNLSRGVVGEGAPEAHVMKLNYTPLQHAIDPVEEGLEDLPGPLGLPVAVLGLHGQLAPAAFAMSRRAPGANVGFIQTAGGALPGQLSRVVAELRELRLIGDHVTVAPCFGGTREAMTLEGALQAAAQQLGWEGALIGPGPGIIGSASALGHGGLEALHSAHSALAVGCDVILAPRLSSGDPRERHLGLSHHSAATLALLLGPVAVAVGSGISDDARKQVEQAIATGVDHELTEVDVEELLRAYAESGLPARTMGRELEEDEDFFRAALAAGLVLAARMDEEEQEEDEA